MTDPHAATIEEVAAAVKAAFGETTGRRRSLLSEIDRLVARLERQEFQLAVLGQFKRGKSTLVNALVGRTVLASGVLPLTASPTFLRGGNGPSLTVTEEDGRIRHSASADPCRLAELVRAETTRAPGGGTGTGPRRVEVTLPAEGLLDSMVLIDTPGVGSSDRRSTEVARAALPDCDAAIFVVSVDPPVTEAELDYLACVAKQTDHLVFVLNKVDLVSASERAELSAFVASTVSRVEGVPAEPEVFPVSATAALRARMAGDVEAEARSGLAALEAHVRSAFVGTKRSILTAALARRLAVIAGELEDDVFVERRALILPLAELDEMIAGLDQAEADMERARTLVQDRFRGQWTRTSAELERVCSDVAERVGSDLIDALAKVRGEADARASSEAIGRRLGCCFEREASAVATLTEARIAEAAEQYRSHCVELAASVTRATNAIVGLPAPTTPEITCAAASPTFKTSWLGRAEVDSLGSLTADGFSVVLPPGMRRAREHRRLAQAAQRALRRNAVRLHWHAKQAVDDAFRALLSSTPGSIDVNLVATRDVLAATRRRRSERSASLQESVERCSRTLDEISEARSLLAKIL